jgi:hypothetical protein
MLLSWLYGASVLPAVAVRHPPSGLPARAYTGLEDTILANGADLYDYFSRNVYHAICEIA